jgi:hypothetical protein
MEVQQADIPGLWIHHKYADLLKYTVCILVGGFNNLEKY